MLERVPAQRVDFLPIVGHTAARVWAVVLDLWAAELQVCNFPVRVAHLEPIDSADSDRFCLRLACQRILHNLTQGYRVITMNKR